MTIRTKQLTYSMIESSTEVKNWLSQFTGSDRITAITLLLHLKFIPRDTYSDWLLGEIRSLNDNEKYALYAVRKFPPDQNYLWDDLGEVVNRPGGSLGSEDLVYSIVANAVRSDQNRFFDHPSLEELKENRIHQIVLIDDSIGSGKRMTDFIKTMTINKSFLSWWSYGLIKFHILALVRMRESERYILKNTQGSNHGIRKYRKSQKINFNSAIVYGQERMSLNNRWGDKYLSILDLCDSIIKIPKPWRRGFKKVMGNYVFYHSVPNNIPGILFCNHRGWIPLFPGRAIPDWLGTLFQNQDNNTERDVSFIDNSCTLIPDEWLQLLVLIKSGVRNIHSLALRSDCDSNIVFSIIQRMKQAGLMLENHRLSETGIDLVVQYKKSSPKREFDFSQYVPQSWRTDRESVQPSAQMEVTATEQADPFELYSMGGEAGQASLERTDAKADKPPINVMAKILRSLVKAMTLLAPRGLKVK